MKKRNSISNILLCSALCLLIILSACILFACNKGGGGEDGSQRAETVQTFVSTVLVGRNEAWQANMSAQQIAELNTPGDYVVESNWVEFLAEVLNASDIQSVKLVKLNETLASEDGKAFLKKINSHTSTDYYGQLIGLVRTTGFLAEDVSEIAYSAAVALVDRGSDVLANCTSELNAVGQLQTLSDFARENLNGISASVKQSIDSVKAYESGKQATLNDLQTAEKSLKQVFEFAFDTYGLFASDGVAALLNGTASGSLDDVTDNDVTNFLTSVKSGLSELNTMLGENDRANEKSICAAVKSLNATFGNLPIYNSFVSKLVDGFGYAEAFSGYVGTISELLLKGYDAIDAGFVADVRFCAKKATDEADYSQRENYAVLTAKYLLEIGKNLSSDAAESKRQVYALVDRLGATAKSGADSGALLVLADVMFNGAYNSINGIDGDFRYIASDKMNKMLKVQIDNLRLGEFQKAYYEYLRVPTDASASSVHASANLLLKSLGNNTIDGDASITYVWFKSVVDAASKAIDDASAACVDDVVADLKKMIDELYANDGEILTALSKCDMAKNKAQYAAIQNYAKQLTLFAVFCEND